jgi:hypothetical protein
MRDRSFVANQIRANSGLKSLLNAIPRSLAGVDRRVNRDAKIRRGLNQLKVLRPDSGQASLMPTRQPNLHWDAEFATCRRNGLVNSRLATVNDHQLRTAPSEQTANNPLC